MPPPIGAQRAKVGGFSSASVPRPLPHAERARGWPRAAFLHRSRPHACSLIKRREPTAPLASFSPPKTRCARVAAAAQRGAARRRFQSGGGVFGLTAGRLAGENRKRRRGRAWRLFKNGFPQRRRNKKGSESSPHVFEAAPRSWIKAGIEQPQEPTACEKRATYP